VVKVEVCSKGSGQEAVDVKGEWRGVPPAVSPSPK